MKASEALIAWTPRHSTEPRRGAVPGQVRVGTHPDESRWSDRFDMYTHANDDLGGALWVFIYFNTLVVRDGIDPQVAHEAFLAIDEYAERISPDIVGAR